MPKSLEQLSLVFADVGRAASHAFVPTRALRRHRRCNFVLRQLHYARRFFPEFTGTTIRVGLTRAASGMAVAGGNELWFNPSQLSYHIIAHELTHLLQGRDGIPTGEKSCDVFSLARHWTLNDRVPYYVRTPAAFRDMWGNVQPEHAKLFYDTASRAIELRKSGVRNYIAYFENTLEHMAESRRRSRPAPPAGLSV